MSLTIFNAVSDVAGLAAAIPNLIAAVEALQMNTAFQTALANAPHTHAEVTTLSALTRSLQNDVSGILHDKNFLSILNAIHHLIGDGGTLVQDVTFIRSDTTIIEEIAASPVLQSGVESVLNAWTPVQAALQSL
jgi:hypothetical protein